MNYRVRPRAATRAGAFFAGDWIAERMKTPFILPILYRESEMLFVSHL
jgi:hypothetical protein